ncbi:unnamed protein product [Schistocephalus solidus]|uniref:Uncharacterized protein n=1 Tax=Schistocephalus solidus TaxID=70667 RepID=A0A3P7DNN3_SCHSO|nr:unnamed protein product [Schistocephalus solidus]
MSPPSGFIGQEVPGFTSHFTSTDLGKLWKQKSNRIEFMAGPSFTWRDFLMLAFLAAVTVSPNKQLAEIPSNLDGHIQQTRDLLQQADAFALSKARIITLRLPASFLVTQWKSQLPISCPQVQKMMAIVIPITADKFFQGVFPLGQTVDQVDYNCRYYRCMHRYGRSCADLGTEAHPLGNQTPNAYYWTAEST